MIVFTIIRYKNFLGVGNYFIEIPLNTHSNTLIVGENGSGKSTIADALTFALFGKGFRKINKGGLVNSINTKDCLVELEFNIGSKKYLIRRGIKPNIFEIVVDGVLLNQDARAKDYQDMLERMILKMNYKSFTQIVVLGSASFTPFMALTAADRREVIEDLLDIQIFSNMNVIVKDRLQTVKDQIHELKIHLENVRQKIELHKKHIEELQKNNKGMIASKRSEIANSQHQIVEFESILKTTQKHIDAFNTTVVDEPVLRKKNSAVAVLMGKIDNNKLKLEKEVVFYKDNDTCPSCKQSILADHKTARVHACDEKILEFNKGLQQLQKDQDDIIQKLADIAKTNQLLQVLSRELSSTSSAITHTYRYINILENEITNLGNSGVVSGDTADQSKQLFDELSGYIEQRKEVSETKSYLDVAATLLKDAGIKTRIIKQYLPVINKLVNKYLAAMDFFVNFTIDEEFNESIKSRHRDDFSYENFSGGEKQKIDLALLMTWRAIARIKNSVNTNLLILDETFDSSLDVKGTDALLQILQAMPDNTNVFVISHKDQLNDKFNHSIRFEKKQNFSRIAV